VKKTGFETYTVICTVYGSVFRKPSSRYSFILGLILIYFGPSPY